MQNLTKREKEILLLAIHSTPIISKRLTISQSTIKTHFQNIFNKLEIKGRFKALLKALKYKQIQLDDISLEEQA